MKNTIFVCGLPKTINENVVTNIFKKVGDVQSVKLQKANENDPDSTLIGLVTFTNENDAKEAVTQFDGCQVNNMPINVYVVSLNSFQPPISSNQSYQQSSPIQEGHMQYPLPNQSYGQSVSGYPANIPLPSNFNAHQSNTGFQDFHQIAPPSTHMPISGNQNISNIPNAQNMPGVPAPPIPQPPVVFQSNQETPYDSSKYDEIVHLLRSYREDLLVRANKLINNC